MSVSPLRASSQAAAVSKHARNSAVVDVIPWREKPRLPMTAAVEIAGISSASIYAAAARGELVLRRLAGRTLVETKSFIEFIENDEAWTPSERGKAGRAAKAERARAAWRS